MNDAQVKHLVDRFLGWRLPATFSPDAGIAYQALNGAALGTDTGPTGTNLLDATQADEMVRHLIEGLEPACEHCGGDHRGAKCPLVAAIELWPDGRMRVEFWPPQEDPSAPAHPESDADYRKRLLAKIGLGTVHSAKLQIATGIELDAIGSYYDFPRRGA